MSRRLTVDVECFQKLLEAAYVLQYERDRELSQSKQDSAPVLAHPETMQEAAATPAPQVDFIPAAPLPTVSSAPEVAGALALAEVEHSGPATLTEPLAVAESVKKPPVHAFYRALNAASRRSMGPVIGTRKRAPAVVIKFKRPSKSPIAYAGPVAAMIVVLALLLYLLGHHHPGMTSVSAASKPVAVTDSEKVSPPMTVSEASHLRVTDPDLSTRLEDLSRFEIHSLRRKAEFGDDVAALTLGMAYETGDQVRQSCKDAAHWIAIAAQDGNAAAAYNLGLRYRSGDGTPEDLSQSRKWLEKAANQGYGKARLALEGQGF